MKLDQFYYTSCEQGLSGYAGFQFNAVTPNAPTGTVQQVQTLVGYEAPAAMVPSQTPEELARCPVNLCYQPGPATVLAQVKYLGRDFSRRPGNYFAHALAAEGPADLGPLLPIELWRADFWQDRPIGSTELPAFTERFTRGSRSPSPDSVRAFLKAHRHGAELPRLATAAALAVAGRGRSVLIVEPTSDDVAHWIAAVCYLLPPRMARQLSFATYLFRPSRSRLHVLGTVPEADMDLGEDAGDAFVLFDFANGRIADIPAHPLVSLIHSIGLTEARALWSWTEPLARGDEQDLDDWYPVGLAAVALGEQPLAEADLDRVFSLLADASGRIGPNEAGDLRRALFTQPALENRHLSFLAAAARKAGDNELYSEIFVRQVDYQLGLVIAGDESAQPPVPIESEPVRERVLGRVRGELKGAGVPEALRLFDWARGSRLDLPEAVQTEFGDGALVRWALEPAPRRQELYDLLGQVLDSWPPICGGLMVGLTREIRVDPRRVDHAMAGPLGVLLGDYDLADYPEVAESRGVGAARREPARRPEILLGALAATGRSMPEPELLNRYWPKGKWSLAEAYEMAQWLEVQRIGNDRLLDWFVAPLRYSGSELDTVRYLQLARLVLAEPVGLLLNDTARKELTSILELDKRLRTLSSYAELRKLLNDNKGANVPIRLTLLNECLPEVIAGIRMDAKQMCWVLGSTTYITADRYLQRIRPSLVKADVLSGGRAQALAGLALALSSADPRLEEPIWEILEQTLRPGRRSGGVEKVADIVDSAGYGSLARELYERYAPPERRGLSKLWKKSRTPDPTDPRR